MRCGKGKVKVVEFEEDAAVHLKSGKRVVVAFNIANREPVKTPDEQDLQREAYRQKLLSLGVTSDQLTNLSFI